MSSNTNLTFIISLRVSRSTLFHFTHLGLPLISQKMSINHVLFPILFLQTNLIKESIRMGYNDYCFAHGQLSEAFKNYVCIRDYCTTWKHVVHVCLNAIFVSIDIAQLNYVTSYVSKAEQSQDAIDPVTIPKLHFAAGLTHLENRKYKQAAPKGKRWSGCFGGLSCCFNKQKGRKRIVPASRKTESNSFPNLPNAQPAGLSNQATGGSFSLYAPPSSPTSFSQSPIPSTTVTQQFLILQFTPTPFIHHHCHWPICPLLNIPHR